MRRNFVSSKASERQNVCRYPGSRTGARRISVFYIAVSMKCSVLQFLTMSYAFVQQKMFIDILVMGQTVS